jgi:hypothetical protein
MPFCPLPRGLLQPLARVDIATPSSTLPPWLDSTDPRSPEGIKSARQIEAAVLTRIDRTWPNGIESAPSFAEVFFQSMASVT